MFQFLTHPGVAALPRSGSRSNWIYRDEAQAARIVHIADAYDAMTSDRPNRRGMSHPVALRVLQEHAGTQFDPVIVPVFVNVVAGLHKPDSALAAVESDLTRSMGCAFLFTVAVAWAGSRILLGSSGYGQRRSGIHRIYAYYLPGESRPRELPLPLRDR